MQVILIKDLPTLGRKGEIKNVTNGYARNFLLPQKLAILSTALKIKELLDKKRAEGESQKASQQDIKSALEKINNKKIILKAKSSPKGTLFKAVLAADIVKAVKEQWQVEINPSNVALTKPLKQIGQQPIKLKHPNQEINLIIEIRQNHE